MRSDGRTDIGKKRVQNQDSIFFTDEPIGPLPNLYIVADGMGGHKAGDVASKTAIECVTEYIKESAINNSVSVLKRAILYANDKIYKMAKENEDWKGMGTTLVAAVCEDNILYVAKIRQVTMDHSLVEELIRSGQLDRNKGRNHPEKNIITRALGISDKIMTDFFELEMKQGDEILLCSDGLSNMLEDDEIKEIVLESSGDITAAVEKLIDRANYYGGRDNISVVVAVK